VDAPLGIMVALFGLIIALLIRRYWPQIESRLPTWLRDLDRRPGEGEPAASPQA
jgi:hypothetical protein